MAKMLNFLQLKKQQSYPSVHGGLGLRFLGSGPHLAISLYQLCSQPAQAGFLIINTSHPRALTGPQAQGNLLGRHLNDIRTRGTGALAAERQASQDPGAAGWALKLASAAVFDQVCLQVTPGGD